MSPFIRFAPRRQLCRTVIAGFLFSVTSLTAAQSPEAIDPNQADPERRKILSLIETLETLGDDQRLLAAETFDVAWAMAVQGEDPVLNLNTDLGEMLKPGQHEVNAGARSRLQSVYEQSSDAIRQSYEEFAANGAKTALRDALNQGDTGDLIQVILRYQFTEAGQQALKNVIQLRLSRGEVLQAALQFGRLMRLQRDESAQSLVQLSTLWWRAGLPEEAADYLAVAAGKYSGEKITLSGRVATVPATDEDLRGWLQQNSGAAIANSDNPTWQQVWGNYRRTGTQAMGPAGLDKTWTVSGYRCEECVDCMEGDEINRLLEPMKNRLDDYFRRGLTANETVSPVAQPIVVNDLLIFRGAAKILAVDRKSGELAWETALIDRNLNAALELWRRVGMDDQSNLTEIHRIIEPRLFYGSIRDNASGQLTSNGRLVFAVEPATAEPLSLDHDARGMPSQRPVNYLRAYDVATGELKGQAGGPVGLSSGSPVNPLAGMYFLGAPLVMGERIYVIAENDQGIFLLQLKAASLFENEGQIDMRPVRSQLLSIPRYGLEIHPVRRFAGVIPSYSGGLLICNTVDEQVIAISAEDHSLRWMYRYPGNVSTPEINQGFAVLGNAYSRQQSDRVDLSSRWTDALPRIVANRIYVTPRDSDRLICLDLQTGKEIWTRPRGSMRSLAVVMKDRIVLTGQRSIECLSAAFGEPLWKMDLEDGRVSGRAVSDGRILQVPTSIPAIVTFDIKTGRKLLIQPTLQGIPGNLISLDGQVYSQSLTELTSFSISDEQRNSPLTTARIDLLAGHFDAAEQAIQAARTSSKTSKAVRREADNLLIDMLLESLRLDFPANVNRIPELKVLIESNTTPDDRLVDLANAMIGMTPGDAAILPELWAQANSNRKRLTQLQSLVTQSYLTDSSRSPEMIASEMIELLESASSADNSNITKGDVTLKAYRAVIASIREAAKSQSAAQKMLVHKMITPYLTQRIQQAKTPQEAAWWWQSSLLSGFVDSAALMAIDSSVTLPPQLSSAIRHASLITAIDQADPQSAATYAKAMLKQWVDSGHSLAANQLLTRSLRRSGFKESNDLNEIPNDLSVAGQFAFASTIVDNDWMQHWISDPRVSAAVASTPYRGVPEVIESPAKIGESPSKLRSDSPHQTIPLFGGGGAFANWALVQRPGSQVIYAYDEDGRLRWTFDAGNIEAVSDRGLGAFYNELSARYAVAYGQLLAVKLDHMLFMLDCSNSTPQQMPEKLWELHVTTAVEAATDAQQLVPAWQRTSQYDIQPGGLYPVGPVTVFGIPVYSGRRLVVFNTFTGEREWEVDGLPDDCTLTVSGDELLLISKAAGQVEVRQLIDGRVSTVTPLPLWWNDAEENSNSAVRTFELSDSENERWRLAIDDGRCLLVRRNTTATALESYNLKTGETEWSIPLPQDSAVSNVTDAHVAILSNGNELQIIDTKAGSRVFQNTVPEAADNMYLYLRSSGSQWLVITDVFNQDYDEQNPVSESVHVNGQIYSVSQSTAKLSWSKPIQHEWLRVSTPSQSPTPPNFPILMFLKRPYPAPGPNGVRGAAAYQTKVFDIETGKLLFTDTNLGLNLSYYCLRPNQENNELNLGFNIRDVKFKYAQVNDWKAEGETKK